MILRCTSATGRHLWQPRSLTMLSLPDFDGNYDVAAAWRCQFCQQWYNMTGYISQTWGGLCPEEVQALYQTEQTHPTSLSRQAKHQMQRGPRALLKKG